MAYEITVQNENKYTLYKSKMDKRDTEKENKVCAVTSA
jgi:hypothetical protein